MCDSNFNEILNLDFSSTNDVGNWTVLGNGSLSTIDGKLKFESDTTAVFKRVLGQSLTSNNRLRIKSNIEVKKSVVLGSPDIEIVFSIKNSAGEIVNEYLAELESLGDGGTYLYYLDRELKFEEQSVFNLEVKIQFGNDQEIYFKDLIFEDYFFCEENLRTYFVIDSFFEDSLISELGGVKLKSWKADNSETLTNFFFSENTIIGSKPLDNWYFAKSELNGVNRVAELKKPNTFNPFVNDLGLEFDNSNYYGGKPTGTISGNDYGQGLLQLGFDKPAILNGSLNLKKGAFFIDIDFTKNLKIEFDVIINKTGTELYVNADYIRKYVIEWNADTCTKLFYFINDNGDKVDQLVNGFLFGITGVQLLEENNSVGCDETFSPTGNEGNFSYEIDFGSEVGQAGINYEAYSVPDRFILEWNGQVFDTGFVGANVNDQALIDAGVDPADINTASPSNGAGQLLFNKDQATPTTATITVLAPLSSTAWQITGICPQTTP